MTLEQIYDRLLALYGYHVLVAVREAHELDQAFEHCAAITKVLDRFSLITGTVVPKAIDEEAIKDYQAEFWRLGISGDTAVRNFMDYSVDAYLESIAHEIA